MAGGGCKQSERYNRIMTSKVDSLRNRGARGRKCGRVCDIVCFNARTTVCIRRQDGKECKE